MHYSIFSAKTLAISYSNTAVLRVAQHTNTTAVFLVLEYYCSLVLRDTINHNDFRKSSLIEHSNTSIFITLYEVFSIHTISN